MKESVIRRVGEGAGMEARPKMSPPEDGELAAPGAARH